MKIVLQRVKNASVSIDNKIYSEIGKGILILFGVEKEDNMDFLPYMVKKVLNLRIFEDEDDKMNRSILEIQGEILVVSQFTLAANCKKGLRPSFDNAMKPLDAKKIYEEFILQLKKESNLEIKTGVFGAKMEVSLLNDGPVTFILEK